MMTKEDLLEHIVNSLLAANNIILSTHRQADGDGLGAQMAMLFALQKLGKKVRIINVDETPKKYRFLNPDFFIHSYSENPNINLNSDITLIFDTNDSRLLEPLFTPLQQNSTRVLFIDHHPLLKDAPQSSNASSYIEQNAASTGEITFRLINKLGVALDTDIAKCLYTSITFDTQLYRYIRNSAVSHEIAAQLLKFPIDPENIHRHLFGDQSVQKYKFLAQALSQVEYHFEEQAAFLHIKSEDLKKFQLEFDEARDIIDLVMNITTLEVAALIREDSPDSLKLSLRSKGLFQVLPLAEKFGGGGHPYAAGATINQSHSTAKNEILKELARLLSIATIK